MQNDSQAGIKRYCNSCEREVETTTQILFSGPHYARENCAICGRHVAFSKKPTNTNKRAKNKYSPSDLGVDHCQLCLRPATRLGSRGVLESHHVIEIGSGGLDEPSNIWVVCTSCHKLINHQRLYLNIHLKDRYSVEELRADMDRYGVPEDVKAIMERIFEKQEAENA